MAERLDLGQKADEDLSLHSHCVTGSPWLPTRTKARSKEKQRERAGKGVQRERGGADESMNSHVLHLALAVFGSFSLMITLTINAVDVLRVYGLT